MVCTQLPVLLPHSCLSLLLCDNLICRCEEGQFNRKACRERYSKGTTADPFWRNCLIAKFLYRLYLKSKWVRKPDCSKGTTAKPTHFGWVGDANQLSQVCTRVHFIALNLHTIRVGIYFRSTFSPPYIDVQVSFQSSSSLVCTVFYSNAQYFIALNSILMFCTVS